jgi:uncharacterized membrane protein
VTQRKGEKAVPPSPAPMQEPPAESRLRPAADPASPAPPARTHHGRLWLRTLWIPGAVLLLAELALLWWAWQVHPDEVPWMVAALGLLFIAGKEAAIPPLVLQGHDAFLIGGSILLTDLGASLILYQILHTAMDAVEGRSKGFIGGLLRAARRHAARRRRLVDRYGPIGLFMYAIIPFAFNGPPHIAVLGRLAGVRAEHVLVVMVSALVATTVAWTLLANIGVQLFHDLPWYVPVGVSITITAIAFGTLIRGAIRDRGGGPDAAPET